MSKKRVVFGVLCFVIFTAVAAARQNDVPGYILRLFGDFFGSIILAAICGGLLIVLLYTWPKGRK